MGLMLSLPKRYDEIEEEEMQYIDGGYWTHVGHAEWTYTVSKTTCKNIATMFTAGAAFSAALAHFHVPYAAQVAVLSGLLAAIFDVVGTFGSGIRIYFHTMSWGRTPRWVNVLA